MLACRNEIRKNNAQGTLLNKTVSVKNNYLMTLIDALVYRNKRFQTAVYWKIITQETLKENIVEPTVKWKGYAIKCQSRHDHNLNARFHFCLYFIGLIKENATWTWRHDADAKSPIAKQLHNYHYIIKNAKGCVSTHHPFITSKIEWKITLWSSSKSWNLGVQRTATQLIRSSYNPSNWHYSSSLFI